MLPEDRVYAAGEIYSHPEIKARAADPDKGQPARRPRPPRRGILPIGKTQFNRLRNAGKFPEPDAELSGRRLWSGKLLNEFLMTRNQ